MKRLTLIAAIAALGLGGSAMAQMTTEQHVTPSGNLRTTNRVETPNGTASTTRIDRPDGSSRIVQRQTDVMGNHRMDSRDSRMGDGRMGDGRMGDGRMDGDHMRGDRDHRDSRRGWDNHDHGRHGWNGGRKVCRTEWRHGHRSRKCWMSHR